MSKQHVIPVDDLVEHEQTDECFCGPDVEFVEGGQVITHHSLDGRELLEQKKGATMEEGAYLPRALMLAREARRGTNIGPSTLYAAAHEDAQGTPASDLYRHAMIEAGYFIDAKTDQAHPVCPICGHSFVR